MKVKTIIHVLSAQKLLTRSLFLVICLLVSFASVAQDAKISNSGNDPVSAYLEKNKNSDLVKLYLQHPQDAELSHAIRYSMIIDNPRQFPEFTESDIERMKVQLQGYLSDAKQISSFMQNGDSFETAKARNQRNQNPNPSTPQQEQNVPMLSVPK